MNVKTRLGLIVFLEYENAIINLKTQRFTLQEVQSTDKLARHAYVAALIGIGIASIGMIAPIFFR